MRLSVDQDQALNAMLSGKNVFLTGSAGTGKSTVIQEFKEKTKRNFAIVAPTGIAALNVGGQTIHSFFMLPFGMMTQESVSELKFKNKKSMLKLVDTIVIDEISMVRSDVFAAIDYRLKQCSDKKHWNLPFAGKQIICCGDFFQLPPIVSTQLEHEWLNENFGGEYAFQTELWRQCNFTNIIMKSQFRHKDDELFFKMLENIRHGVLTAPTIDVGESKVNVIDAFNKTCLCEKSFAHVPTRLCTTNREVQTINNGARAKINFPPVLFNAVINGNFNEDDYPTEAQLVLKLGLRVMILCNKRTTNGQFMYVNGDCGEIIAINGTDIESKIKIRLDSGHDVWIQANEWQKTKYVLDHDMFSGKPILRQEVIGTFVQMPLKLAYAITIHKSQGMTLDYVDLRLGNGCFAHGQLYTALSRARNLSGLKIERQLSADDVILDDEVTEFYRKISRKTDDDELVKLDIPQQYQEEMQKYLAQLKANAALTMK